MRKFLHYALNRLVITALIVLLQVVFFMMEIVMWGNYYVEIAMCLRLVSFGVIIALILKQGNPAVKMAWIVPILLFPLFGGVMYLALGHVFRPKRLYMAMKHTDELVRSNLQQDEGTMDRLKKSAPGIANQCEYILHYENAGVGAYGGGLLCGRASLVEAAAGGSGDGGALYLSGVFYSGRGHDVGYGAGDPGA